MRNKTITHSREAVKIYENHYKPSFNVLRFTKSILGVLLFGQPSVAQSYVSHKKRPFK
jgi:hypothetical protein